MKRVLHELSSSFILHSLSPSLFRSLSLSLSLSLCLEITNPTLTARSSKSIELAILTFRARLEASIMLSRMIMAIKLIPWREKEKWDGGRK
jgi:hypothetical protein